MSSKSSTETAALLAAGVLLLLAAGCRPAEAQSIGFHPNLNLGFNPYLSPVFGYGLGFPYGAYSLSPLRSPWLSKTILAANFGPHYHLSHLLGGSGVPLGNGLAGKLHASKFLKKLTGYTREPVNPFSGANFGLPHHHALLRDKLASMKQTYSHSTPYNFDYGYKKHYGAKLTLR